MGDSHSKHSEQGEQNSWFSAKKHEGLHKASERPHIQGYDPSHYGVSTPQLSGTQPYKLLSQHWSRCRDERLAMSVMTTIPELQDVSPR